jgi:hypothetical protein
LKLHIAILTPDWISLLTEYLGILKAQDLAANLFLHECQLSAITKTCFIV